MGYPEKHRNRAQGADQIELHKYGTDDGTAVSALTTSVHTMIVDLPYNGWDCSLAVWCKGCEAACDVKVEPYVNHDQTILGSDMYLVAYGTTVAAQTLTIAAQTATGEAGTIAFIVPGGVGGAVKVAENAHLQTMHGLIITAAFTAAITTAGATIDFELLAVPTA